MPTLPLAKTVSKVEVAVPAVVEAIVKSGVLAAVLRLLEMDKIEYGEEVPIPNLPVSSIRALSLPLVVNAKLSAAEEKKPVLGSPPKV